jgi:hypothetical protein
MKLSGSLLFIVVVVLIMILLWRYEYICMFPRLIVGGFATFRNIALPFLFTGERVASFLSPH